MIRVIRKYPLQVFGFEYTEVDVPEGDVLKCDFQHGVVYVWIEHQPDTIHQMRLRLMPTGKEFDDTGLGHVGSAISPTYCWHVYRVY